MGRADPEPDDDPQEPGRPRDRVVRTLAREILSGQFKPGEKLPPEADLGDRLAVSRTALRESIRTLAGKGLIASRSRSGTVVQPVTSWNHLDPDLLAWREAMAPDVSFIRSLTEARRAIEPAAAELAAERATGRDVAAIEAAFEAMCAAPLDDVDAVVKADEAFHLSILAASQNPFFATFGTVIGSTLRESFRVTTSASENFAATLGMHGEVAEAIRLRRPAVARETMMQLLAIASRDLARFVAGKDG